MALRKTGLLLFALCKLSSTATCELEDPQSELEGVENELEESTDAEVMLLQTQLQHRRKLRSAASTKAATPVNSNGLDRQLYSAMHPDGSSQAFVFLFEWSWEDVAKECEDWLGPKGYTAVLVSPPNEHTLGDSWFQRYQPVSYNLTSRSGSPAQFVDMVNRCRVAGVGIYVDAVFNHCAPMSGTGVGGSSFGYRTYPLFGPEDFHHEGSDSSRNCGVSNYNSLRNVQYCDLEGMPDLCTGCPHVQETVAAYINHLAGLGVAGFRVDAAKHMDPGELGSLLKKVNSSLFRFLEVTAVPGEAVQTPMYFGDGRVTEFGYAATLGAKFTTEGMLRDDFKKFGEGWGLVPTDRAVVFLDNQDTQRNGQAKITHKDMDLYTLLNIFMLAYPYGYPKVMSSYYYYNNSQGPPKVSVHGKNGEVHCGPGQPWVCEHRLAPIANMVAWRHVAGSSPLQDFSAQGDRIAFCRGKLACVALNRQASPAEVVLHVSMPDGIYCDVLQSADPGDCPTLVVKDGHTRATLPPTGAVALHVGAPVRQASGETSTTTQTREDEDSETQQPFEELEDSFEDTEEEEE